MMTMSRVNLKSRGTGRSRSTVARYVNDPSTYATYTADKELGTVNGHGGTIDLGWQFARRSHDGYDGLLGWIWVVCAVTTIGLVAMTWFALRERYYSAVMAATGLLYLAILTAFGTDLLARAVLKP